MTKVILIILINVCLIIWAIVFYKEKELKNYFNLVIVTITSVIIGALIFNLQNLDKASTNDSLEIRYEYQNGVLIKTDSIITIKTCIMKVGEVATILNKKVVLKKKDDAAVCTECAFMKNCYDLDTDSIVLDPIPCVAETKYSGEDEMFLYFEEV